MHEADKLRSWLDRSQTAMTAIACSSIGSLCKELLDGAVGGPCKPHARVILVLIDDIEQDRTPRLPDTEMEREFACLRAAVARMVDIVEDRATWRPAVMQAS